jgi:hypothetical protein
MKNMIKVLAIVGMLFLALTVHAQSFRLEDMKDLFGKGKPLKLTGGFSANSVWDAGNDMSGRDPWAWYLNGNVNLNLYGLVDLPFSFSFTNSNSSYKLPSSPNRLSISPSYKWVTAHIGDVSMTFSPYTLNGHIFTGAGVDLTPGDWEFSAMYGRLLKTVEYEEAQPSFLPNYKRMAYGVKAGRTSSDYQVSINLLNAWDDISSLAVPPDSLGITPMENLSGSLSFLFKPVKFIKLTGEYGLSLLTNDRRSPDEKRDGVLGLWSGNNMSSSYYNAFKAHVDWIGESNSIGLGYERIDPGYKTLGAYYFVNDLENITIDASQSFWQEKMSLNVSLGYEHDDLSKNKANISSRVIGSADLSVAFNERVNAHIAYSNFQDYTNVRSNFELINQENPLDLLDTLNFVQINQNASMSLDIITKKDDRRQDQFHLNFSYQDASSKQGGFYQPGSVTEMVNATASYSLNLLPSGMMFNGSLNMNNSKIQSANALTYGPTLEIAFKLFKKKVNLKNSVSYNTGLLEGVKQNEVFLDKLYGSYTLLKKHQFTLSYSFQWRSAVDRPSVNHSLLTVGYAYQF